MKKFVFPQASKIRDFTNFYLAEAFHLLLFLEVHWHLRCRNTPGVSMPGVSTPGVFLPISPACRLPSG
jgi:hypothetical protein